MGMAWNLLWGSKNNIVQQEYTKQMFNWLHKRLPSWEKMGDSFQTWERIEHVTQHRRGKVVCLITVIADTWKKDAKGTDRYVINWCHVVRRRWFYSLLFPFEIVDFWCTLIRSYFRLLSPAQSWDWNKSPLSQQLKNLNGRVQVNKSKRFFGSSGAILYQLVPLSLDITNNSWMIWSPPMDFWRSADKCLHFSLLSKLPLKPSATSPGFGWIYSHPKPSSKPTESSPIN